MIFCILGNADKLNQRRVADRFGSVIGDFHDVSSPNKEVFNSSMLRNRL